MSNFKELTIYYCEKILANYRTQADEKTYTGKEAELLVQRNDFARCVIKGIKGLEITEHDYSKYFKKILEDINSTLNEVKKTVEEYNSEHKTAFTSDLYETLFTTGLISFINAVSDLFQNSPTIITSIENELLFNNNRTVPWIYQFSFILYEYILEREFEIAINKTTRDIFDTKKQLILKYIKNAASLYSRFDDRNNAEYIELMKGLLQQMRSEEQGVQQRKTEISNASSTVFSYFAPSLYKASERIIGKSQLGQKIDFLIFEFTERAVTTGLQCH